MLSIKGLSIPQVIHALYMNTKSGGFAVKHDRPDLTVEEMEAFLETYGAQDGDILDLDYLFGRPMKFKVNKKDMTIDDVTLYERDSKYPAEVVISRLLKVN